MQAKRKNEIAHVLVNTHSRCVNFCHVWAYGSTNQNKLPQHVKKHNFMHALLRQQTPHIHTYKMQILCQL